MDAAIKIASMLREWGRPCLVVPLVIGALVTAGSAQSQGSGDTIGDLVRTSTFSSTEHVNVGKSNMVKQACFFREQGSSHMLDIGVSADGAFIRLAYGDGPLPADSISKAAAAGVCRKTTDEAGRRRHEGDGWKSEPIQVYDGAANYTPNIATRYGSGFIVVTNGDTRSFFGDRGPCPPRIHRCEICLRSPEGRCRGNL